MDKNEHESNEENKKCMFCHSSIDSSALFCKECDKKQTKLNYIVEKWSIKGFITLLFSIIVSLVVWYIPTLYAEKKQEIDTIEQANKDISELISKLEATFILAYEPCIENESKEECIKQVNLIQKDYLDNSLRLQSKISLHYPELLPSAELLKQMSYNMQNELIVFWSAYYQCVQSSLSELKKCEDMRRRRPITHIQIAKIILIYLSHKTQKIVASKTGKSLSMYSDKIINIYELPCLLLPKKELEAFNGWRKEINSNGKKHLEHLDFNPIYKIIWQEYIVPGSGLNVDPGYQNMRVLDNNKAIVEILNKTK